MPSPGSRAGSQHLPIVTLLLSCLLAAGVGRAAESPPTEGQAVPAPAASAAGQKELSAQRTKLAAQIAELEQRVDEDETDEARPDVSAAEEELELLQSLDSLLLQQQSLWTQREETLGDQQEVQAELETLRKFGPSEAKPYSFLLLERLRDAAAGERERGKASAADLHAAEQMLTLARETLDEAESARRLAREELEENEDEETAAALTQQLKLAEQESQIAQAALSLRRLEVEVRTSQSAVCDQRQELLAAKIEAIAAETRFTMHDLEEGSRDFDRYAQDLKRKLKAAEAKLQKIEARQAAALAALAERQAASARIELEEERWNLARRVHQEEISFFHQRLGELRHVQHFWNCRYETLHATATSEQLSDWDSDLDDFLTQLANARRSLTMRIDALRGDLATLFGRLNSEEDIELRQPLSAQYELLSSVIDLCENGLSQLKSLERSGERFQEELREKLHAAPLENWREKLSEICTNVWRYELTSVDDRPITVGKIFTALVYVVVGGLAARLASRLVGTRLLPRLGLNDGASHAIQSILFYALVLIIALLALELVNMPLAAFTFLGGAAAIGIGFGSQNILNNFISGLILLAEQPIRVGDLVEIDGVPGTVEHIGARSTRVRTSANYEIIVPNSKLLENKVTNLTLTDNLIQASVSVGLARKLTLEQARRLLLSAATSHEKVLKTPSPHVILHEFTPDAWQLHLHFWHQVHDTMEQQIMQGEVREQIHRLLDHAEPSVTMLGPATAAASEAAPRGKEPLRMREAG